VIRLIEIHHTFWINVSNIFVMRYLFIHVCEPMDPSEFFVRLLLSNSRVNNLISWNPWKSCPDRSLE
jgi:hypothetical protein